MAKPWAMTWRQGAFFLQYRPLQKESETPRRLDRRKTRGAKWKPASGTFLAQLVAFESLGCLILVGLLAQFAEMRRRQTLGVPAA